MISISYKDQRPIYEQVRENIMRLILTEALNTDEKLPSVRELAQTLAVNPNTIQRAYRELENDGYIYSVSGRGNFVAEKKGIDKGRAAKLLSDLEKIVQELKYAGFNAEMLCERIKEAMDND
ncbi:GntR family transcriptional regulator [Clostridiaceae bacterium OttesenSCG-928-D20]|nr:GntR family transcriptional regulator [Clostridiaceae bacterium OttesenSCG-928-D20]